MTTLEGRFAVSRLPADAAVPRWAAGEVVAVTRTPDELSVICAEPAVPEATPAERGWRCLQVQGPLSLEMTGILAALSGPLADAHIPLLALSTYDTDYLLVREEHLEAAYAALERAGHRV
ncbi:MAG: ACT domain-containing protein [Actinomycetes bacterium]